MDRHGRRDQSVRADAHDLVIRTLQEHAPALLRTARRYSLCADDAYDAYQRAAEIFLRRAGSLDQETMVGWLKTVVKHEAFAVRAARQRGLGDLEFDPERDGGADPGPDERMERIERLEQAAEALSRLKPQEVRALVLRAEGHSYKEIQDATGWTYTKVNRCLTEGRRAFAARVEAIASGVECERWQPVLSAVADGEATREQLSTLRPHLRSCQSCRATLRAYREAPSRAAAIVPAAAVLMPAAASDGSFFLRAYETVASMMHERAGASAMKLQAALDATATGKAAAIAASTVALAGGSVAAVADYAGGEGLPRPVAMTQAHEERRPDPPSAATDPAPVPVPAPGSAAPAPAPEAAPPAPAAQAEEPAEPRESSSTPPAEEFAVEAAAAGPAAPAPSPPPARPAPRTKPSSAPSGSAGEFGP